MRHLLLLCLGAAFACGGTQSPPPAAPESNASAQAAAGSSSGDSGSTASADGSPAQAAPAAAPAAGRSVPCTGDVSLPKGFSAFSSATLGASVALPGKPMESTVQVATPAGTMPLHSALLVREPRAYVLARFDLPDAAIMPSPEHLFAWARDGAISNVQGSLEREEPIECAGFPGREMVVLSQDRTMATRARVVLAGRTLYQVLAIVKNGDQEKPEVAAFLDTFRPQLR
jgi:hypothetical protein